MSTRRAIYIEARAHRRLAASAAQRGVMLSHAAEEAITAWLDGTTPALAPVAVAPAPAPAPAPVAAPLDDPDGDTPTVRGIPVAVTLPRCVVDLLHERARELDLGVPAFIREALTRWMLRQRPMEHHAQE